MWSSWMLWGMMMATMTTMMVMMVEKAGALGDNNNKTEAEDFLDMYDTQANDMFNKQYESWWAYQTNITEEHEQASVDWDLRTAIWRQNMSRLAAQFNTTAFPASMQRELYFIQDIGTDALEDTNKLKQLNQARTNMIKIYSTAKVCLEENNCLPLDPDMTRIFQTSRNESLLRRLWVGWRRESGRKMRDLYTQFVNISNESVRTLGFADTGAYWKAGYETASFEQDVAALFEELRPFYQQLHTFVRRRLKKQYGEVVFPSSGHIPAHLLGNMWAQSWVFLQDLLVPFPDKPILDVTDRMVQQNYTARKIFQTADDFFTSLGLEPMPQSFWDKSMLKKPTDGREVVCHATAWNMYNDTDFRIKQCTEVTINHFITGHHEMGHIQYYMIYRSQPVAFREGANQGFHEAVGDIISLSVQTPKHLHQIGLLPSLVEDREAELNFLMAMALQKIAFLPFGYLIDQWRWSVFRGDTTPDNYNQAWWNLRCNLQGVSPPVKRTEEDFDPGAKYHIPDNTPYIRYFVSYIIQFQFHKALCEAAGHQGPLHTCDIYNSTQAGDKLRAMLSKGRSDVWTVPFQAMTGQTRMSAQPLIQYFQPLMTYLEEVNKGESVGWSEGCPSPVTGSAGHLSLSSLLLILMILVTVYF